MPTYEFCCLDCRRRFDLFLSYSEYGQKPVQCPHCASLNVQRKIGRIRMARSDENRLESMADPSALAGLEDDPKSFGAHDAPDELANGGRYGARVSRGCRPPGIA